MIGPLAVVPHLHLWKEPHSLTNAWEGRLPHWMFRGLLSVHSRFGPHGR